MWPKFIKFGHRALKAEINCFLENSFGVGIIKKRLITELNLQANILSRGKELNLF